MNAFLIGLESSWTFLLQIMSLVFSLYTEEPVFMAVFTLWLLDRIFHIFDLIKG